MTRLWAFLNSAVGVLLLSALVIGPAAWAFAEWRGCKATLAQDRERLDRLAREVIERRNLLFGAIVKAGSEAEMKQALRLAGRIDAYTFVEFKERTLDDLEQEYARLEDRVYDKAVTRPRAARSAFDDFEERHALDLALAGKGFDMDALKRAVRVLNADDVRRLLADQSPVGRKTCAPWRVVGERIGVF